MSAVMRLRADLGDAYDDAMMLNVIGSETDALELLDQLTYRVIADEAVVDAGKARLKRIEARADRNRALLMSMMTEIGEKIERPLATLSIGNGSPTAIVTDAKAIPEVYWRRSVDKVELLRGLRAGPVDGAELSNGAPHLVLRKA